MVMPTDSGFSLNILVVDDEANIRKTLSICLESCGHKATAVGSFKDALSESERQVFDLAFVDLRLGTENGLDLIPRLLGLCPWLKIVVITAYASIDTAVEAMRRGAADYIPKPFTPEQVEMVTGRVSEIRSMEQKIAALKDDISRLNPRINYESKYPSMQRAISMARQVASSEASILLRGPSGTGKSELAKAIHSWSPRANQPLGIISCPTLSSELLESELFGHIKGAFTGAVRDNIGRIAACEGGSLFLDEIGEMPPAIQAKLLRFLQSREYERVGDDKTRRADVRIITATNSDIEKAVKDKTFREDLYYRLNVIQIELPPLSERPDDVEEIAKGMLKFFGSQNHKLLAGFSEEAIKALRNYSWPGNLRELRNVIERAAILCAADTVGIELFPVSVAPRAPSVELGDPVKIELIEENHIRRVLASAKSLQEAAEVLGIDQATLWRKRKQYGI
jgi:two-component system, NtrC family, response regulator AlgB